MIEWKKKVLKPSFIFLPKWFGWPGLKNIETKKKKKNMAEPLAHSSTCSDTFSTNFIETWSFRSYSGRQDVFLKATSFQKIDLLMLHFAAFNLNLSLPHTRRLPPSLDNLILLIALRWFTISAVDVVAGLSAWTNHRPASIIYPPISCQHPLCLSTSNPDDEREF